MFSFPRNDYHTVRGGHLGSIRWRENDNYSVWFGWLHFIRLSDKRLFIKRGRDTSWFNYYFVLVSYIHFPNIAGTLAPFSSSVSKKESPVE